MSTTNDTTLKILKEIASKTWYRKLYVSEITTTPEVTAIKTCEIKIRSSTKTTASVTKHEFMWTFSNDDSDFIEVVYTPKNNTLEEGHEITINTPLEEGWGKVICGRNDGTIAGCSLFMYLTTKSEISNAPFESRNIHLKIDATTSKNEHLINVVIIEMDSNKKSYIKTGKK